MNTTTNNAALITRYRESVEHMTTQKSTAAHNRFRDNPFVYNFAVLLKGISDGIITRKNHPSAKTVELICKGRELPKPLTSAMLTIYGRTNKTIAENFLNPSKISTESKRNAIIKATSVDDICEYIYLAYQKKRKYKADSTLEELVDFANLTGYSVDDILWTNDENSRKSVHVYIPPEIIETLDGLDSEFVFPAFSIPAYGVSFYLKVTPKQTFSPNSRRSNTPPSKSTFELFYHDPMRVIKPFLCEQLKSEIQDRHSTVAIHDWYEAWVMAFTVEPPQYFLKTVDNTIKKLPDLSQTRWHKEWDLYQREIIDLQKKRLRENQYLLSDYEGTVAAAPKRKPSLDERLG